MCCADNLSIFNEREIIVCQYEVCDFFILTTKKNYFLAEVKKKTVCTIKSRHCTKLNKHQQTFRSTAYITQRNQLSAEKTHVSEASSEVKEE